MAVHGQHGEPVAFGHPELGRQCVAEAKNTVNMRGEGPRVADTLSGHVDEPDLVAEPLSLGQKQARVHELLHHECTPPSVLAVRRGE